MPRRSPDPKRGKKPSVSPASLRRRGKPKFCVFCRDKVEWIDYKDVNLLRRFLSDRAKIKARRVTGTCREHQGHLASAIKTSRELALLPYVLRTAADRLAGRGGRRGRDGGGGPGGRRPEGSAPGVGGVDAATADADPLGSGPPASGPPGSGATDNEPTSVEHDGETSAPTSGGGPGRATDPVEEDVPAGG